MFDRHDPDSSQFTLAAPATKGRKIAHFFDRGA
jgi:hypothetical protein